uniref:Biogenesis of lysosome-related organelles complex 1 subunit 7 n=1 Tax=Syphacia muris TaxID=451379 RepID=A0A0N5APZ2_9BILA
MSVDEKIEDIRQTIAKIHRGLYKFNQQLNGTLTGLDSALSSFDQEFQRISSSVSVVKNDVTNILKHVRV